MLLHRRHPPNILVCAGNEDGRGLPASREKVHDRKSLDYDLEPHRESRKRPSEHARVFWEQRHGSEAIDFWRFGENIRFEHVLDAPDDRDVVRVRGYAVVVECQDL